MAEDFLRRWSRLKHQQAKPETKPVEKPAEKAVAKQEDLPPIDKLTPDSDFRGFMQPKVEDAVRRVALKKLFKDPHFNIPDPFEPYSRDWNVAEPISEEMLAGLNQARTLLFDKQHEEKPAEKPEEPKLAEEKPKDDEPGRQDA